MKFLYTSKYFSDLISFLLWLMQIINNATEVISVTVAER